MPQVICLGEILFDCIADRPGVPLEQVPSWTSYPGGAPANVACALTKLGTSAGFLGCVGKDDLGQQLVDLLSEVGVETTGIQRHPTAPTRQVMVTRSITGDRQFAAFGGGYATSEFADAFLEADRLPEAWLQEAKFLVIGTLELAYPQSVAAIHRAIELVKQAEGQVFVDINWRSVFWDSETRAQTLIRDVLHQADYLKLTDDEATWLFQTQDLSTIAAQYPQIKAILMTAGERGCTYWIGGYEGTLPAFAVDVEDTTGAGDSFLAGFLHQLCQRDPIGAIDDPETAQQMVTYASAVGALTTARTGAIAAQPTAAEVEAFLHLTERMNGHGTGN